MRFNKVFGYFIEVTKANLHLVPEHYQRKQTIANGERYITPELKEYESKVLHAQERIEALELELFQELRGPSSPARDCSSRRHGAAPRRLDVLASAWPRRAATGLLPARMVDDGNRLRIVGGRHPVVEQTLTERRFVPNDTELAGGRAGRRS